MSDFDAAKSRLHLIGAILISLAIAWFSLLFFHAAPGLTNFPG